MKMMKFFLLTAAAVAAISCAKENLPVENDNPTPEVELVPMTFTASYAEADDAETKVAYEDGATVWKVDDKIMLIASDGTATEFTATSVEGNRATFEGLTNEKADSYYAVSPASAYVGNDVANGKIYANIPQNQTAVAGSFDPKAFLSVASNEGSELYFRNSCSVVGFKLSAPAGVKSVRFTATDQTNLAGTGVVKTSNIPTHTWDGTYEGRSAFDMITLNAPEGGFLADTDYYLTIRANTCPNGIKVYVEYEDQVKSRNSANPLFPSDVHPANMIRNLGQLDKNLTDTTPYDSYQMGFDIVVAGKVINKATYGDATLVTKAQGLNNNGVYFINSDVEGVTMNSGKSIIVIGNDPSNRSKVSRSGFSYLPATAAEDYWVLSNIDFTITTATSYALRLNGGSVCEMIIMDNCSSNIPTYNSALTQYFYGDSNNKAKEIIIKDSEFLVEANGINNFLNFAATQTVDNITFENNVFYSANIAEPATNFILISAGNTTATNLKLHKNTFYGAYTASNGFITNCLVTDVTVTKNLFGLRTDATQNVFVVGKKISNTMNFKDNGYFKNGASAGVLTVGSSNAGTGTNDSIGSKGISTDGWNPSEGKFTLNAGFGATR